MPSDTSVWLYFRVLIGVVLLSLFAFLVVTSSLEAELISGLLALLVGILLTGESVTAIRASRIVKKKD